MSFEPPNPSLDTPLILLTRYAYSQTLSRSPLLSVLEESLDLYLFFTAQLPYLLEKTGKPRLGHTHEVSAEPRSQPKSFFDTSDPYWAEPELKGFFKLVTAVL